MGEPADERRGPRFLMGKHVTLRRFERCDLPHMRRWLDDAELRSQIAATSPMTGPEADEWFARMESDPARLWYAIVRDGDERVIGEAGLLRMFPEWGTTDLTIIVGERDARGSGHGSETGRLLLDFAFDYMCFHRVAIGVVGFHEPALRFWEKLGFRREGLQRDGYVVDGEFHDFVMMSMLEDEWRARKGRVGPDAADLANTGS
ncbi:MAG: GNAT family protein [Candidatus Eisenbacteria bacterium]